MYAEHNVSYTTGPKCIRDPAADPVLINFIHPDLEVEAIELMNLQMYFRVDPDGWLPVEVRARDDGWMEHKKMWTE